MPHWLARKMKALSANGCRLFPACPAQSRDLSWKRMAVPNPSTWLPWFMKHGKNRTDGSYFPGKASGITRRSDYWIVDKTGNLYRQYDSITEGVKNGRPVYAELQVMDAGCPQDGFAEGYDRVLQGGWMGPVFRRKTFEGDPNFFGSPSVKLTLLLLTARP